MKTIVVLGMHRSATSMIAKGLHDSGIFLGDDLLPPSKSNPWGHYEERKFVHLNDRILYEAGGSWKDPPDEFEILLQADKFNHQIQELVQYMESKVPESYPIWGWKDPRTTLTIKLFMPHLTNPHIVACMRTPEQVAESLNRRDGIPIDKGTALAKEYNKRLMFFMAEYAY